jgi:hypothetical protein
MLQPAPAGVKETDFRGWWGTPKHRAFVERLAARRR